ncbi:MAG: rRNA processing protein RimM [Thermoleophilaceae bacterium]|nr:rRNA processing protein RimM [Thermoleophilaceae bacterium]
MTQVSAGRVGRAHGRDGSFYVSHADHALPVGTHLRIAGVDREVVRRAGTDDRPIIRLDGVDDREAAVALQGEVLLIDEGESPLDEDEYLVSDLVGCEVPGVGYVERVLDAPSCALLEVGHDGILIPLISDAVKQVDLERRVIEVDREFLGL